ncbi:MAG TPA: hypothetical protein EYG65_02460 [Rhodospirillales bacterium]|nr:hypothetical protein [Rhodospirillales bacterium]
MDPHHVETIAIKLTEIRDTINAASNDICEILSRNQTIYTKATPCSPMPDVVEYGNWEIPEVEGIWGTGSSWKKIGWLGHTNNFNPHTKAPTTLYHEFTKWLLKLPKNRNFWMTGNSVEYFQNGQLLKVAESVFRLKHADTIKHYFEQFVDNYSRKLLKEAKRVLGDRGPMFMQKLHSYIDEHEFTNAKDDSVYSNQICKATIKQIRYHLREKIEHEHKC